MTDELKSAVAESLHDAMRARDRQRAGVLRLITAEVKNAEIAKRTELDDDAVLAVLSRMAKQRRASVDEFTAAGRDDLANQEQSELEVIESFMPQQLSADDVERAVADAIEQLNASSMQDMGKVMGALSKQLAGQADMSQVSAIVRARLQS